MSLIPPPVAPWPGPSFHTVSELITPADVSPCRLVPPQASACGLDAGKSAWLAPSVCPSALPLSPAAAHTVTPSTAPSAMAASRAERACAVHESSDWPS